MEDRETARMRKYGESKTTRIMMATVPHVTSGSGLRKFQADGFLFDRVYKGVLPTVVSRCVWSRNLVNEEALAYWELLHQINICLFGYKFRLIILD